MGFGDLRGRWHRECSSTQVVVFFFEHCQGSDIKA